MFLRLLGLTCVLHVPDDGHPCVALSNPTARGISHFFEGVGKVWILWPHSNTGSLKLKPSLFSCRGSMDLEGAALINVDLIRSPVISEVSQRLPEGVISSDSDREFSYNSMPDRPSLDNQSIFIPPISNNKEAAFNNFPDRKDDRVFFDQLEALISENTLYELITLEEPVLTLPIIESNSSVHVGEPHKEAL
ncbi:hypothetical protein PanWU01x14_133520 [Parasponia andersonii]|uniref:Uncharacterized protein n=1 Tax=Parasponia andersonii TaxID=3476 RepID=A0A2P5CPV6_PARAD|nr:hypothetical protein PanWU01x14_133520 [Parasponia andersonii]